MENTNENTSELDTLLSQLSLARNEIKNLRQQLVSLKHAHRKDVEEITNAIKTFACSKCVNTATPSTSNSLSTSRALDSEQSSFESDLPIHVIGRIETGFSSKRGVPRQPGILAQSQGIIRLDNRLLTNPNHALEGLEHFSHMWIIFYFHANESTHIRAKVAPPRLNGIKTGVFATRSPHRPSPLGLSLVKIDSIQDDCVYFSGVDMVDETPVLDLKPYIPQYDIPYPVTRIPHGGVLPAGDSSDLNWQRLPRESDGRSEDGDSILQDQSDTDFDFQDRLLVGEASQSSNDQLDGSSVSNQSGQDLSSARVLDGRSSDDVFINASQEISTAAEHNRHIYNRSPMRSTSQREAPEGSEGGSPQSPVPSLDNVRVASWITNAPVARLGVQFSDECERKIERLIGSDQDTSFVRSMIVGILSEDPRSVYIRERYSDEPFTCIINRLIVTCFFDDSAHVCLVTDVENATSQDH